jgi:hypothetical protein
MRDWAFLIHALEATGYPPTAEGLADALWLAQHLPAQAAEAPGATEETRDDGSGTGATAPAAATLPQSVALRRALLPLRRSVPSRTETEIDEVATADTIAEAGVAIWLPVVRPAPERWLDVALIADGSASMIVWQSWISSITQLLEHAGVFRIVRVWSLDTDHSLLLRPRAGGLARSPAELMDPAARQIFLVLSDCVGRSWRDGTMARILEMWARSGTVTIVQPLAERMWQRCGPEFVRARITARSAGAAITSPYVVPAEPSPTRPGLPVLVIQLGPDWLDWWASLIAGRAAGTRSAAVLFTGAAVRAESPVLPGTTARDLVGRFRASASPPAFELAVRMAVTPLNLATMRFILSLTARAQELHLAEVLLGGLLRREGAGSLVGAVPGDVGYDFRPGVRELLLSYMTKEDVVTLLQEAGKYLHASLDTPAAIHIATPLGDVLVPDESFAVVSAEVLQFLGGPYADAASDLRASVPSVRRPKGVA